MRRRHMEDPLLILQYGSDRRQHREEGRKEGRCRQFVQLHITANAQITFCDNASCSSASASVDRGVDSVSAWPAVGHLIRVGLRWSSSSLGENLSLLNPLIRQETSFVLSTLRVVDHASQGCAFRFRVGRVKLRGAAHFPTGKMIASTTTTKKRREGH